MCLCLCSAVVRVLAGVWCIPHPVVHGPTLLARNGGAVPSVLAADFVDAHRLHVACILLQGNEEVSNQPACRALCDSQSVIMSRELAEVCLQDPFDERPLGFSMYAFTHVQCAVLPVSVALTVCLDIDRVPC